MKFGLQKFLEKRYASISTTQNHGTSKKSDRMDGNWTHIEQTQDEPNQSIYDPKRMYELRLDLTDCSSFYCLHTFLNIAGRHQMLTKQFQGASETSNELDFDRSLNGKNI